MIKELIIAICVLAFSGITLFIVIPDQIYQRTEPALIARSPAFFPKLAAWIILVLSVLLIISHIQRIRKGLPSIHENEETLSNLEHLRVAGAIVISIAYYILVKYLGFWIANTACVAALFILQDRSRIVRSLVLAFVVTVIVYLFFHHIMRVHFPVGEFFR